MKLLDALLFAVFIAFLIMGVYHTFLYGITYSYGHFMIVVGAMLWLNMRRVGKPQTENAKTPSKTASKKTGKKK